LAGGDEQEIQKSQQRLTDTYFTTYGNGLFKRGKKTTTGSGGGKEGEGEEAPYNRVKWRSKNERRLG
jgi:hypothetical protein